MVRIKNGLVWLWVTLIVVLADRYTKIAALQDLVLYQPKEVFPGFELTLAFNKGAAFSFLHTAPGWQNLLLGAFAFFMIVIILIWLYRSPRHFSWTNLALACILAGAVGNLWDRCLYGYVIDFIDLYAGDWHWPIFNIADSAISLGAVILLFHWIKQPK